MLKVCVQCPHCCLVLEYDNIMSMGFSIPSFIVPRLNLLENFEFFFNKVKILPKIIFNLFSVCRIRIRYEKWGSPAKIWRKMHSNLTWTFMRSRLYFRISLINIFSEISPLTLNFFFTDSDVAYQKLFK